MPHVSTTFLPKSKIHRRWRWYIVVIPIILLLAGVPGSYIWYRTNALNAELQALVDDLDVNEPQWRMHQIEANRPPLPDEENGALVVIAARRKLPRGWVGKIFDKIQPKSVHPPAQLNAKQIALLRKWIERVNAAGALEQARTLAKYSTGRHKINWTPDYVCTLLPHVQDSRDIALVLQFDAMLLARDGKMEQAWQSAKAIYHDSMSLGNIDCPIILMVRVAVQRIALDTMERVLAQGEINDESLAAMQPMLEKDLQTPTLLTAMRTERANMHGLFANLENATVPLSKVTGPLGMRNSIFGGRAGSANRVLDYLGSGMVKQSHIWFLKYINKAVNAAKQPTSLEQYRAFKKLAAETRQADAKKKIPDLAGLLLPAIDKTVEASFRVRMQVNCAIVGLACERFRLKHKHWPKRLDELVEAGLIENIPIDVFNGKPINYQRFRGHIVEHSDGDAFYKRAEIGAQVQDPNFPGGFVEVRFRLWDVMDRRRPPAKPAIPKAAK